jgi:hypothetical protein
MQTWVRSIKPFLIEMGASAIDRRSGYFTLPCPFFDQRGLRAATVPVADKKGLCKETLNNLKFFGWDLNIAIAS